LRRDGREALVRERTGLGIDPLFSAAKLSWLIEHTPDLSDRAGAGEVCFGTVDSWLLFSLTAGGLHATDHSNAARTQLLNLHTRAWDPELLDLFRIPVEALPTLHTSTGFFAECRIPSLRGVPIVAALGDSHAALAGHGGVSGDVKATYGTGSSMMTLSSESPDSPDSPDSPEPVFNMASRLSHTIAWSTPGTTYYALEGNITMTGATIQWLGEFLGLGDPVEEVVDLADSVLDSAGVYLVPAMSGLGAPHWDSDARGIITGLTRTSSRAHLARAAVESIAFQVRDVFDTMLVEAGIPLPVLYVDGGATRNDSLMQFQADVLGRPVFRSTTADLSALGAAGLAGLELGWWKSLGALPHETTAFLPAMGSSEREQRYSAWRHAIFQARA
jgi:glycerol kinase